MPSLIARLRERQIVQWSLAYLAGAWLLLQVADVLGEPFAWPPSAIRTLTVLLVAGLPFVVIVSWYHGQKGLQRVSGMEILMLGGILMIAAAGLSLVRREPIAAPGAPPSAGTSTGSSLDARAASPDPRTIAVLPFANISADSGNEYFADGMTEELIGALARVPGLRVAARSSVFALKGRQLDVREAGELLRAATVLEGSVRRDGQRLQVSAQLIDAKEGYLIWGEEFDRDLADVFAVQDEIARAIVDALRIQLMPTSATLVPRRTENLEAYRAYAKGRHFIRMRGGDGPNLAVGLFERAIALDSGYAQAWAGLAEAHTRLGQLGYAPAQEEDKAASIAALAALELDSTLAEAHRALAHIRCAREWKWSEAEREYQRALALDPQDVATHELYGLCLVAQGKFHAARPLFVGAYELDPLQPFTSNLLGRFYLEAGQPDSAIHYLEEAVELGPDLDLAHQQLGHAYLKVGRNEEAIASFLRAATLTGARDSAHLAYAYAVTGRKVEARAILQHLIEANRDHPPVVDLALGFSGLGDADEAFRWLERGFDEHAPFMDHIMVASGFEPLRSDPRFTRLLARMGLTPGHGPRP